MVAVTNGTARVLLRTLMTRERSAFVGRVRGGTETKTGFALRTPTVVRTANPDTATFSPANRAGGYTAFLRVKLHTDS